MTIILFLECGAKRPSINYVDEIFLEKIIDKSRSIAENMGTHTTLMLINNESLKIELLMTLKNVTLWKREDFFSKSASQNRRFFDCYLFLILRLTVVHR